jgi:hypothetical protein
MKALSKKKVRTTEQVLKEQEAQANAARENAVVRAGSTALAADGANPWIEVSAELDKYIGAPFVRFSKQGEYEISETETIPLGTRCIAHVDEAMLGYRKWAGNQIVDRHVGRVADRFVPPQRRDLGDTDEHNWELRDDGTRTDPWQFHLSVPLTILSTEASYLFTVTSKGGLRCVSGLVRGYGGRVREKGNTAGLPIVELAADSYKHRTYGKIFFPVLHNVGCTGPNGKPLSLADEMEDAIPDLSGGRAA